MTTRKQLVKQLNEVIAKQRDLVRKLGWEAAFASPEMSHLNELEDNIQVKIERLDKLALHTMADQLRQKNS